MQKVRILAMGCGTLALALGAGHFMQAGTMPEPGPSVAQIPDPAPDAEPAQELTLSSIELTSAMPSPPGDRRSPAALPEPAILPDLREAALGGASVIRSDALPVEHPAPSMACKRNMTADAAPGAMVALLLDAPCAPDERFTLHHNGMMFTHATDQGGRAAMLVPALTQSAVFIAGFANGEGAVAKTEVTDLGAYQRVVVQWQGDSGMSLHALEFGAEFGSAGHVRPDARRDVAAAATGEKGFMSLLGDADQPDAFMAQVYTFPSVPASRDGTVTLMVEAEVTPANCARDIEAQSLQTRAGGALKVQDVTLMMPECDAVGDFLVLKNLLNDFTIASN